MILWGDPIPDVAGEILAARAWCQIDGRLLPIFSGKSSNWATYGLWQDYEPAELEGKAWADSEPQTADCWGTKKHHDPNETSPAAKCVCGFWGLVSPDALVKALSLRSAFSGQSPKLSDGSESKYWPRWSRERAKFVLGTVKLWGKVIPGELGWRAQHAQIAGIIATSHPRAHIIARRYGVPTLATWPELTPAWKKEA